MYVSFSGVVIAADDGLFVVDTRYHPFGLYLQRILLFNNGTKE